MAGITKSNKKWVDILKTFAVWFAVSWLTYKLHTLIACKIIKYATSRGIEITQEIVLALGFPLWGALTSYTVIAARYIYWFVGDSTIDTSEEAERNEK